MPACRGRSRPPFRHAGELLDSDGICQRVEAGAALLFGEGDAEPAHLAEAADHVTGEAPLALVRLDHRLDLARGEIADRAAQQLMLG